mmetsp:Transcript_13654/g.38433  ORF Transcript_13654/g.38433 Transcript_13654/m.38433 type:complete len:235 (+) Transcript_13654:1487-2191(+)
MLTQSISDTAQRSFEAECVGETWLALERCFRKPASWLRASATIPASAASENIAPRSEDSPRGGAPRISSARSQSFSSPSLSPAGRFLFGVVERATSMLFLLLFLFFPLSPFFFPPLPLKTKCFLAVVRGLALVLPVGLVVSSSVHSDLDASALITCFGSVLYDLLPKFTNGLTLSSVGVFSSHAVTFLAVVPFLPVMLSLFFLSQSARTASLASFPKEQLRKLTGERIWLSNEG